LLAEPSLAPLLEHAARLDLLDRSLRDALPPTLAPHCRLANVRESHLVFVARSPAAASRLRLYAAVLLDTARLATGQPLKELTVKVAKRWESVATTAGPNPAPLSTAAAAHLGTAASATGDPELRDLFRRLASKP
jgi:hypothetical protein